MTAELTIPTQVKEDDVVIHHRTWKDYFTFSTDHKVIMMTSQLIARKEEYEAKLLHELSMSEEKNQYMTDELTSLKNILPCEL